MKNMDNKKNGANIVGFVFAVLTVVPCFAGINDITAHYWPIEAMMYFSVAFAFGLTAFITCLVGVKKNYFGRGFGIAGITTGVICFIVSVILFITCVVFLFG